MRYSGYIRQHEEPDHRANAAAHAPRIDAGRFRADLDAVANPDAAG